MSKTTTNYELIKPELTDAANITAMNPNWDKIDKALGDAWYKTAVNITENADLNNYSEIGIYTYSATAAATISNVPEKAQGTLMVLPRLVNNDTTNLIQVIITGNDNIYVRNKYDNTWNDWEGFATVTALNNHGRHVPTNCVTIEDWNTATSIGWYMSQGENKNAPVSSWCFGFVIAHNENYVFQEVYDFTKASDKATNLTKYIRSRYNGTWTPWINVTVQRTVPEDAKLDYIKTLKSDVQTQINDLTTAKMNAKPGFIEFAPNAEAGYGGYLDFHFNGSTEDYTTRIMEDASGHLRIIAQNGILVPSISPTTNSLRNIQASTADLTAGTSTLANGDLYFVYE